MNDTITQKDIQEAIENLGKVPTHHFTAEDVKEFMEKCEKLMRFGINDFPEFEVYRGKKDFSGIKINTDRLKPKNEMQNELNRVRTDAMRDRLIELLSNSPMLDTMDGTFEDAADYLLANGVEVIDTNAVSFKNRPLISTVAECPIDVIIDLVRARDEGRIIVPPCKVGSGHKVFIPIKGTNCVLETKVYGIGIDEDGDMVINPNEYPEDAFSISGCNVGKTVFLTREEAEQALKGGAK